MRTHTHMDKHYKLWLNGYILFTTLCMKYIVKRTQLCDNLDISDL